MLHKYLAGELDEVIGPGITGVKVSLKGLIYQC